MSDKEESISLSSVDDSSHPASSSSLASSGEAERDVNENDNVQLETEKDESGLIPNGVLVVEKEKLKLLGLISVIFFMVCGGAYGTEDMSGAIPPLFCLIGMAVVPLTWSLPAALVTAELAVLFPDSAGFVDWESKAWGDLVGRIDGALMMIVVLVDQAVYPTIFASYMQTLYPMGYWEAYFVQLAFLAVCLLLNIFGLKLVERSSGVLQIVSLAPFALFTIMGFFAQDFDLSRAFLTTSTRNEYKLYLSVVMWATTGWEYAGFLAASVESPEKRFPRALVITVFLMIIVYTLPMLVSLATNADNGVITQGVYPALANNLGFGHWFGVAMIVGGLGSTMGTYMAYLLVTATGLRQVASEGNAPSIFNKMPNRQSPIVALVFLTIITAILILLPFEELVQGEVFLIGLHVILLCSCIPRLRHTMKDVSRTYKIPLGWFGCYVIPALPVLLAVTNIFLSEWRLIGMGFGLTFAVIFIFVLLEICKRRRARNQPDFVGVHLADGVRDGALLFSEVGGHLHNRRLGSLAPVPLLSDDVDDLEELEMMETEDSGYQPAQYPPKVSF